MSGFFGIGHLPGEAAASRASDAMGQQADMFNKWNQQYYQPGLQALWQQYQNPNTPYQQSQMSNLQEHTYNDYNTGAQKLQQGMAQRGLGQSSIMGNSLSNLWNQYGQTMANARQNQMGQQEQLRQQSLARLMGSINPNAAMNAYGQQYQLNNQQTQGFMNSLGGLGSLAGYFLNGTSTPSVGATTGGIAPIAAPLNSGIGGNLSALWQSQLAGLQPGNGYGINADGTYTPRPFQF